MTRCAGLAILWPATGRINSLLTNGQHAQKGRPMRAFTVLFVAALAAGSAFAGDMVYKDQNVTVRLRSEPCATASMQEVLAKVQPEGAKVAEVMYQGRVIAACWAAHQESGNVVLIDADGDAGMIPMDAFRPAP